MKTIIHTATQFSMQKVTILAAILLVFSSCEKVVDIDLNEANPQLVVEGVVSSGTGMSYVLLTETNSFYEFVEPTFITGATVTITSTDGSSHTLSELANGIYVDFTLTGVPGETYSLRVEAGERVVTASSTMPPFVELDSLVLEEPRGFQDPDEWFVQAGFQDSAATENFYRFNVTTNGERQDGYAVFDDSFFNGNYGTLPLFDYSFFSGDTSTVDLIHMDEANYIFYNGLSEVSGGGGFGDAAPGNPEGNLQGDGIGIFGAYAVSSLTQIIP